MKLKTDFITNSSSTSYVISLPIEISSKDLLKIVGKQMFERRKVIRNIKQLITYTQADPYDWVNDVKGPRRFFSFDEDDYKKWFNFLKINKDRYLVFISVDRNDDERKQKLEHYVTQYEIRGVIEEREYT